MQVKMRVAQLGASRCQARGNGRCGDSLSGMEWWGWWAVTYLPWKESGGSFSRPSRFWSVTAGPRSGLHFSPPPPSCTAIKLFRNSALPSNDNSEPEPPHRLLPTCAATADACRRCMSLLCHWETHGEYESEIRGTATLAILFDNNGGTARHGTAVIV